MKEVFLYTILAATLFAGIAYSAYASDVPQYTEIGRRVFQQDFCTDLRDAGLYTQSAECFFKPNLEKQCSTQSSYLCENFKLYKSFRSNK